MRNRKLMKGMTAILAASISMTSMPVFAKTSKTRLSVSNCIISKGDKFDLDMIGVKETKGKYQVSNKKVARITNKGIIKAKRVGKLKAIWKKDKKKYVCNVKIVKAPTVSKSKITLTEGKKAKISVAKYGNSKLKVKWISKNKKIAKVTNGKITGISKGTTTIIAKIQGNKKVYEKTIKVVVKEAKIDTNINDVNSDNQNTTTIKPDDTKSENTTSEIPKKDDTLDKPENNSPNKDTVTNTNNGGSNNNWSGNNTGNIPNKPSPGEVVKPELPTGGAIEPEKPEIPTGGAIEPEKPEIPTGGAIEPEKPEIPTGGAIEPEKPEIPTGGAIEPEKPEVPTGGAIEPEKPEKNENDVKALQELIEKQKQKGANVSEDINNAQYIWEENRLVGIHWADVGLVEDEDEEDEISFADLPELKELDCSNNSLAKLPKFYTNQDTGENTTLKMLNCSNNPLNSLDSLDVSSLIVLEELNCSDDNLVGLPEIYINPDTEENTTLKILNCSNNELDLLDVSKLAVLEELNCSSNGLTKSPKFYVNPDTKENITLKVLDCSSNALELLDVSNLTVLEELNCSVNDLTELPKFYVDPDTKENITLKVLDCSSNVLELLDVSNLTILEELNCSNDNLLESPKFYANPDTKENVTLKVLDCSSNQLDLLDISKLTELEKLILLDNEGELTKLDLRNNPKLSKDTVECESDMNIIWKDEDVLRILIKEQKEEGANVSEDINSEQYKWEGDRLIGIHWANVGLVLVEEDKISFADFPELKELDCSNNELDSLDVSMLTMLEELNCSSNGLTELPEIYINPDTEENTTLKILNCSNNQLDSLNVSMLTMLEELDCSSNELTKLTEFYTNPDTRENTTLKVLNCSNNQLNSLDVNMLTILEKFILQDNEGELEEVDLSNNPKLSEDNDSVDCDLGIIWYSEEDVE